MTALVLATAVVTALAVLGDRRARRRLRRTFADADADPAATTSMPRRRRRRHRGSPTPSPIPSPLLLELLAALLESGAPPPTALRHLAAALAKTDDSRAEPLQALALDLEQGVTTATPDLDRTKPPAAEPLATTRRLLGRTRSLSAAQATDPALTVLREAVRMAALAGLPPAALIRRAASEERRRLGAARRRAIRRLEVILVLPVGLCLLPAFVLLGVIPVVIDLFGG